MIGSGKSHLFPYHYEEPAFSMRSPVEQIKWTLNAVLSGDLSVDRQVLDAIPMASLGDANVCNEVAAHVERLLAVPDEDPWLWTGGDNVALVMMAMAKEAGVQRGTPGSEALLGVAENRIRAKMDWLSSGSSDDVLLKLADKTGASMSANMAFSAIALVRAGQFLSTYNFRAARRLFDERHVQTLHRYLSGVQAQDEIICLLDAFLLLLRSMELLGCGDFGRARAYIEQGMACYLKSGAAGRRCFPNFSPATSLIRAMITRCAGQYAEAAKLAVEARNEYERLGDHDAVCRALVSSLRTFDAAGDDDAHLEALTQAAHYARVHELNDTAALLYRSLGLTLLSEGRSGEAREAFAHYKDLRRFIVDDRIHQLFNAEAKSLVFDLASLADGWNRAAVEETDLRKVILSRTSEEAEILQNANKLARRAGESLWDDSVPEETLRRAAAELRQASDSYQRLGLHAEQARRLEQLSAIFQRLRDPKKEAEHLALAGEAWRTFRDKDRPAHEMNMAMRIAAAGCRRIALGLVRAGLPSQGWEALQDSKAVLLSGFVDAVDAGGAGQYSQETEAALNTLRATFLNSTFLRQTRPSSGDDTEQASELAHHARVFLSNSAAAMGRPPRGNEDPIASADVISNLPADSILVQFLMVDLVAIAFVFRPDAAAPEALSWLSPSNVRQEIFVEVRSWTQIASQMLSRRILVSSTAPSVPPAAGFSREEAVRAGNCLRSLWSQFIEPVVDKLKGAKRLYLVMQGWTHGLPLHAAISPEGDSLIERFDVRYLPSAAFLSRHKANLEMMAPAGAKDLSIASIVNPERSAPASSPGPFFDKTLAFSEWEGDEIVRRLDGAGTNLIMKRGIEAADVRQIAAWSDADILHFSCHGSTVPGIPLVNHLRLANDILMAHDVLFRCQRLKTNAFVVLNACSTNEPDIRPDDEALGIAGALLAAGAKSVLGTLWPLHDFAAAFIVINFLEKLVKDRIPQQEALSFAIDQLKKLTWDETLATCESFADRLGQRGMNTEQRIVGGFAESLKRARGQQNACSYPFSHPAFWAPFQLIGN